MCCTAVEVCPLAESSLNLPFLKSPESVVEGEKESSLLTVKCFFLTSFSLSHTTATTDNCASESHSLPSTLRGQQVVFNYD